LRIRERPDVDNLGQRVLDDCEKLKLVRDQLVDWVLLESGASPSGEFEEALISQLEQILELKSRPSDVNSWNETWFEAHRVFVYETFLYVVAALLRAGSFDTLRLLFTTHYQLPETEASRGNQFGTFDAFYGYSELLQILAPEGQKLLAPAATLIKRQADRSDIPFASVMQAELLILMMTFVIEGCRWYQQTLLYSPYGGTFPFFVQAARHRDFQKLGQITGIPRADQLRVAIKAGHERLEVSTWSMFWMSRDRTFWESMNMDELDTLS
jgi:hypothetical protein